MPDGGFSCQLQSILLGLKATSAMGELGSSVQFLAMLMHLDFLNMSGDFSDLGSHSSNHDYIPSNSLY